MSRKNFFETSLHQFSMDLAISFPFQQTEGGQAVKCAPLDKGGLSGSCTSSPSKQQTLLRGRPFLG